MENQMFYFFMQFHQGNIKSCFFINLKHKTWTTKLKQWQQDLKTYSVNFIKPLIFQGNTSHPKQNWNPKGAYHSSGLLLLLGKTLYQYPIFLHLLCIFIGFTLFPWKKFEQEKDELPINIFHSHAYFLSSNATKVTWTKMIRFYVKIAKCLAHVNWYGLWAWFWYQYR